MPANPEGVLPISPRTKLRRNLLVLILLGLAVYFVLPQVAAAKSDPTYGEHSGSRSRPRGAGGRQRLPNVAALASNRSWNSTLLFCHMSGTSVCGTLKTR